jgi:threonine synthase
LKQLKKYGGRVITVTDDYIIQVQAELSRCTGLFTEPAGAAAMAGFLKIEPDIARDETIVVLTTGNGLKDISTASRGIAVPENTIASLDDIK